MFSRFYFSTSGSYMNIAVHVNAAFDRQWTFIWFDCVLVTRNINYVG